MKHFRTLIFSLVPLAGSLAQAQGDPEIIAKILDEGKSRSQVMRHLEFLTVNIGPRLTGSSRLTTACNWTRDKFASFGLSSSKLEQWGEIPVGFYRGARQVGKMVLPFTREFQFTSRSWTAGTNGPKRGPAVLAPESAEDASKNADLYRGAWVINRQAAQGQTPPTADQRLAIRTALRDAGALGTVTGSRNELVITSGSWQNLTWDKLPTDVDITVRASDYEAITSALSDKKRVELEFEMDNRFENGPVPVYNVVAEIKGTEKPDEVIIVSGHLDSWDGPGSQGAVDNGTGCSTALEAARILMAAGAKPKRTIRFILWTGEEQGLWGSRRYVEMHKDELSKISAVFVDDGGTNYSGGLVCIAGMEAMLKTATDVLNTAFPDLPVKIDVRAAMPRGGGSDHAPFNGAGVPGFFWTETGVSNYNYMHHTQHDSLPAAIEKYLVQSSVAHAITAYNLACADTLLPRQGGN
ncbi:MAG: M20/M25/M40 family metallo-hydrolase [Fimbriimonadales bacterium]